MLSCLSSRFRLLDARPATEKSWAGTRYSCRISVYRFQPFCEEQSAGFEQGVGCVGKGNVQLVGHVDHALARAFVSYQQDIGDVTHLRRPDRLIIGKPGYQEDVILQDGQYIAHQIAGEATLYLIFQMGSPTDQFPVDTCKNFFEFHRQQYIMDGRFDGRVAFMFLAFQNQG